MIKNLLMMGFSAILLFTMNTTDGKKPEAELPIPPPVVNTDNLPFQIGDEFIRPLRELRDDKLEQSLTYFLNNDSDWKNLINQKQMAVGLVDLRDPYKIKFATVNGDEMMYAASLPKIAILLAAMDALEKKELKSTPTIDKDLNAMIRRSDNQASTRMIDRLGYDKIEQVLTDSSYQLYDDEFGGGLWVGKRYAASGARHPDPIKGLSHAATASQVCRFYYLLAMGKLVNLERSKQMLAIMDNPALHHKFVYSLDRLAPQASVFRKSGSWKEYHADSAIVWGKDPKRRYILVALVKDPNGEKIIRKLVETAEKVLNI